MKHLRWWKHSERSSTEVDLDRYFAAFRDTNYPDAFEDIHAWLERTEQSRPVRSRPFRQKVIQTVNYVSVYRFRLAGASLLLAVLMVACTMPVEQTETLGYILSAKTDKAPGALAAIQALPWAEEWAWRTSERIDAVEISIVLPNAGEGAAQGWQRELETMAGVRAVQLEPLAATVEQPVYKAVLGALFFQKEKEEFSFLSEALKGICMHRVEDIVETQHKQEQVREMCEEWKVEKKGMKPPFLQEDYNDTSEQ